MEIVHRLQSYLFFLLARHDEMSKFSDGYELKKDDFDVHIIHSEGRGGGKERVKLKHKHKTMLIDKGKDEDDFYILIIDDALLLFSHLSYYPNYGRIDERRSASNCV